MSKYVMFSFDDGRKDQYEIAYRVMKRYGLPATINIVTEFIDNENLFDCFKTCDNESLTWNELQEMVNEGGWEVANHGATHKNTVEDIESWFKHEQVVKNGWDNNCGFASPGSYLTEDNSSEILKLNHSKELLYIRSGKQVRREGLLYSVATLLNRYIHSKKIFYWLNKDSIITYRPNIIKSVGITAYDTVDQVECLIRMMKEGESIILMFHSILPDKCLDKAKDYWYWSESQLTRLCEFLCNDEDYQVLTTKDWWLRHEV